MVYQQNGSRTPEILDVGEVAAILRRSQRTVRRLCASGELPAVKLGGTWLVNARGLYTLLGMAQDNGVEEEVGLAGERYQVSSLSNVLRGMLASKFL